MTTTCTHVPNPPCAWCIAECISKGGALQAEIVSWIEAHAAAAEQRGYQRAVEDGFQECDPAADQGGSGASEAMAAIYASVRREVFEEANAKAHSGCGIAEFFNWLRARAAEEGSDA
jgi:hypothetical protein